MKSIKKQLSVLMQYLFTSGGAKDFNEDETFTDFHSQRYALKNGGCIQLERFFLCDKAGQMGRFSSPSLIFPFRKKEEGLVTWRLVFYRITERKCECHLCMFLEALMKWQ